MKEIILDEPIKDKNGNTFTPKKFGYYPTHISYVIARGIYEFSKKYLYTVTKWYKPLHPSLPCGNFPKFYIGFPNDHIMTLCHHHETNYLTKGKDGVINHQAISSRIHDNSDLYLFYDFWDLLSFFTLHPELEEKINFIVLNRHTKNDHNYKDALNLIIKSHFSKIFNFVKIPIHQELAKDKAIAETKRIQYELECYCEVFPRWKEFEEESLNHYLISCKKLP